MAEERRNRENKWISEGLFILPHKPNYFLAFTTNESPNQDVYVNAGEPPIEKNEVKFQLSLKVLLGRKMIKGNGDLYFGYTQLSLWQLYNREYSSPFRDTNYEPELFMNFDTKFNAGPLLGKTLGIGIVHQSNGQTDPLSRSWNRVYAMAILEKNAFAMTIKPWIRIPEEEEIDNNKDIEDYMGHGELRFAYRLNDTVFSAMLRNNLNFKDNKGAAELAISFALSRSVKGYIQYFHGYGECLIDYNHSNNRIGVGIALSDWL